jgi:hypothetical protein
MHNYLRYLNDETGLKPAPGSIDNSGCSFCNVSPKLWYFLKNMYGGGPEIIKPRANNDLYEADNFIENYSQFKALNSSLNLQRRRNTIMSVSTTP